MTNLTRKHHDDLMTRMTYNTNAIENSTITLSETTSILLDGVLPIGKSTREIDEVINHSKAFNLMIEKISNGECLDRKAILDLHYVLMDKLDYLKGQYKQNENIILGSSFKTAPPQQVPMLIEDWYYDLNQRLKSAYTLDAVCYIVADKHIEFERIHPFNDGNGRIGRLLMNYSLLEKDLPACVIPFSRKDEYLKLLFNQDISGLASLIQAQCELEVKCV